MLDHMNQGCLQSNCWVETLLHSYFFGFIYHTHPRCSICSIHSCSNFFPVGLVPILWVICMKLAPQPELHWIHPSNVGCCQDFVAIGTSGSIRWAVENMDVDKWGTITTCWAEDPGRDQDKSSWDQKSRCDTVVILLREEILHHLGCIKPCELWDIHHINWLAGFLPSTVWRMLSWLMLLGRMRVL